MFVLVHSNRVLVGPIAWNPGMFLHNLRKINIDHEIPKNEPTEFPYVINNTTEIRRAHINKPKFNGKIQYLEGPHWDLSESVAVANYLIKDQSIDSVKGNLKKNVAEKRWGKEVAGTKVTVQGQEIKVNTDRLTRANLALTISSMNDSSTINWKFNKVWLSLSKADVQTIIDAVNIHVQSAFDWEKSKIDDIESKTSLSDLNEFVVITKDEMTFAQRFLQKSNNN